MEVALNSRCNSVYTYAKISAYKTNSLMNIICSSVYIYIFTASHSTRKVNRACLEFALQRSNIGTPLAFVAMYSRCSLTAYIART